MAQPSTSTADEVAVGATSSIDKSGIHQKVVVHPIVLLSAVDHYNRVAKNTKKRVVGMLLGESSKGVIDVTNSYAVPFEEDERDNKIWFLDHSFHEAMFSMFKKVRFWLPSASLHALSVARSARVPLLQLRLFVCIAACGWPCVCAETRQCSACLPACLRRFVWRALCVPVGRSDGLPVCLHGLPACASCCERQHALRAILLHAILRLRLPGCLGSPCLSESRSVSLHSCPRLPF